MNQNSIIERIQRLEEALSEGKLSSCQQAVEEMERLVMTCDRIDKNFASSSMKEPEWWLDMRAIENLALKFIKNWKSR